MRKVLLFIVTALMLIAAGGALFFFGGEDTERDLMGFGEISLADPDATDPATLSPDVPKALAESTPHTTQVGEDMRGYQNAKYKFGLLYPQDMDVREYTEQGGAMSVTFDNEETHEGFQIYVTPYKEKQITEARFKLDQPSGVYREPTDVIVSGTRATMFFGQNAIMGDTREVWFIHGGYLYEVVTYKELDSWLAGLMKTWRFL